MIEEQDNSVLMDFQDLTVTEKELPLSDPEQDNSIVMEAQDLTVTERVNPIEEEVAPIEEEAYTVDPKLFRPLLANVAIAYDVEPDVALTMVQELALAATSMYSEVMDPIQLLTDVYTPQSFEFTSLNIDMNSIEMVEQKHQDAVVKKSQGKIKDELKKYSYAMKSIDKLPQGYKDFLQAEWKDKGRTFSDAVKELQILSGVKADGWLGKGTLKALLATPQFKGTPTAAKVIPSTPAEGIPADVLSHIELREGNRTDSYGDSLGYLTGGVGHLLTKAEQKKYPEGTEIPETVRNEWKKQDTKKSYAAARKQAEDLGIDDPDFIGALTSVNFQLGTAWKKKWPTAYKHLKNKEYYRAIQEIEFTKEGSGIKSQWNIQTPVRVKDFVEAISKLQGE